jgi:formylmethanofuran dehydrogenase subunit D
LRTKAAAHGSSLGVFNTAGREVFRYTGLKAYDKNGRKLPAHFETTSHYVRVVVCDTGAAYPVRIDPFLQTAKLTASDGKAQDKLGYALAVSADGRTVAAGAYSATIGSHVSQGAVYIFQKKASGWTNGTQTAKLTASDGAATDTLGFSVAISADGSTVVAGAPNAQIGTHYGQGAVYVFQKPASGWANTTQRAKLTALNGAANNNLGYSVAISPNTSTIAAGAYHALIGNNASQGAVYVFAKPASGWKTTTQTAKLTASDGSFGDLLGSSVAVSSQGGASIVAGAMGKASFEGSAYVFKKPASGWANVTQTAELSASNGGPAAQLGVAIAVSTDGGTVVAGASGINVSQGAAYVFQKPASGWTNALETAELTASDGQPDDGLGQSVALSSGGLTIAAGALNASIGVQSQQGAVYLYQMPASGWANATQIAKLTASDGAALNNFGSSVALGQDATTLIAGSPGATIGTNSSQGAVYTFQGPLWQNAIDLGKGWQWVSWFGSFYTNSSQWIYHSKLGWLYPFATSTFNLWFWDPKWQGKGGWWWTTNTAYPWIFSSSKNAWLYYYGNVSAGRLFYNSSTGQWEID